MRLRSTLGLAAIVAVAALSFAETNQQKRSPTQVPPELFMPQNNVVINTEMNRASYLQLPVYIVPQQKNGAGNISRISLDKMPGIQLKNAYFGSGTNVQGQLTSLQLILEMSTTHPVHSLTANPAFTIDFSNGQTVSIHAGHWQINIWPNHTPAFRVNRLSIGNEFLNPVKQTTYSLTVTNRTNSKVTLTGLTMASPLATFRDVTVHASDSHAKPARLTSTAYVNVYPKQTVTLRATLDFGNTFHGYGMFTPLVEYVDSNGKAVQPLMPAIFQLTPNLSRIQKTIPGVRYSIN
ncbi:hypothetical protein [Ferroacidibacillus organovorans]|uniref:Uncharacterized protein n=1 Tax=Ferroacidibacillus organovorans TaxID=1765683 RepID=A0A101XTF3_9BACL|nr:hypothetical protein [Ferroacidibacillus organovorans]KUO97180.1 hypothetical protein ATW55_12815 [Ferroacidibacillus organovorans]